MSISDDLRNETDSALLSRMVFAVESIASSLAILANKKTAEAEEYNAEGAMFGMDTETAPETTPWPTGKPPMSEREKLEAMMDLTAKAKKTEPAKPEPPAPERTGPVRPRPANT
jgi:hypothetical protein